MIFFSFTYSRDAVSGIDQTSPPYPISRRRSWPNFRDNMAGVRRHAPTLLKSDILPMAAPMPLKSDKIYPFAFETDTTHYILLFPIFPRCSFWDRSDIPILIPSADGLMAQLQIIRRVAANLEYIRIYLMNCKNCLNTSLRKHFWLNCSWPVPNLLWSIIVN